MVRECDFSALHGCAASSMTQQSGFLKPRQREQDACKGANSRLIKKRNFRLLKKISEARREHNSIGVMGLEPITPPLRHFNTTSPDEAIDVPFGEAQGNRRCM